MFWQHVSYETLAADCRKAGWDTHVFAVEVGARGYDKVQGTRTYSWDIMHFFVKKISTPKSWSKIVMLYITEKQINCTFRKSDFGPL